MTTGSDKCSISSIIPMSCRGRAEAFARRLHSRLSSLGSQDERSADENSWLAGHENSVAVSQPRHSDPDLYFDFALLDSPGSPEEEVPHIELSHLITNEKDNLNLVHGEDCHCSKQNNPVLTLTSNGQTISSDSDSSDGQYFDPDTDDARVIGGVADSVVLGDKKVFEKSNDSVSTNSLSCTSEEDSTLSLQDYPSLEYNSCLQELSICNDSLKDIDLLLEKQSLIHQGSNDLNETFTSECDSLLDNDCDCNSSKHNGDTCDAECDIILRDEEKKNISEDEHINGTQSNLQNGYNAETTLETDAIDGESYCSTLRIENNLTVDINGESECDLVNEVQLDIDGDDNIEDREEPIPRVRRCSSLKTGKTPPGTPGRKKIVRFADVLGLDLADVRTYLDEIPKIPNSAYADLSADSRSCFSDGFYNLDYKLSAPKVDKLLLPLFQQPGGQTDFIDKVRENQVCLENAIVEDPIALSIKGSVRVRNLDFNKSVHIRYSLDSWKSFSDLQASYVENSCDGFSDKFTFLMYVNSICVGQRVEFAVRFQCKGAQYWDNNNGANYCFQCLPVTNSTPYTPITGVDDSWGAAFYYTENPSKEFAWHRQAAVQEYIAATLDKHKKKENITKKNNPDLVSLMVIIIFSIVFLYIQRAIYFT